MSTIPYVNPVRTALESYEATPTPATLGRLLASIVEQIEQAETCALEQSNAIQTLADTARGAS